MQTQALSGAQLYAMGRYPYPKPQKAPNEQELKEIYQKQYGTRGNTKVVEGKTEPDVGETVYLGKGKFEANNFTVPLFSANSLHWSTSPSNGTIQVNYAPESTEENPIVIIDTIDVNGDKYQSKINVNAIDPKNATYPEMVALNAHLKKTGEITSPSFFPVPPTLEFSRSMYKKQDFTKIIEDAISAIRRMGDNALEESDLLDAYLDFWDKNH